MFELNKLQITEDEIRNYTNLPLRERLQKLAHFIDNSRDLDFYDQEDLNKVSLLKELYTTDFQKLNLAFNNVEWGEGMNSKDYDNAVIDYAMTQ
jgi:hypothetical protein